MEEKKNDLTKILDKIIKISIDDYYNPYEHFKWPASLDETKLWMSKELLSIYGTEYYDALNESELIQLSKWESVNFYSMNVHGIKELIGEVIQRIHMPGFEEPSRYFHHFIGEENEHMYFFAQFCSKYGGKIYQTKKMKIKTRKERDIENFIVFCRILLFEEIVDFYNLRMSNDTNLDPIIQEINKIHHQDESRHISFGRQLVKMLWKDLCCKYNADVIREVQGYLKQYIISGINDFYNPAMYRDAKIKNGLKIRNELTTHPARIKFHKEVTKKVVNHMLQNGILMDEVFQ